MLDIIFNILSSGLPCCLLALGIFLTFRLLDFADLTAEGSFLIGACTTGVVIYNGGNPFLATFLGFLAGGLCGFTTGVLNRFLKIPKLLSGIITMTASATIAQMIMGFATGNASIFKEQLSFTIEHGGPNQTIYSLFYPWKFSEMTGEFRVISPWGEVIKVAVLLAVVVLVIVLVYFFFGTEYGMAIRTTGMNEKMAKAQGINTDITTIVCVTLSNALIALGGALYVQDVKRVSTISATGYLVVGLASIIVGEAIFGKRTFKNWLISVSLGSILYFVIITIAIRIGVPTEFNPLIYAVLITIALCIPFMKKGIVFLIDKIKARIKLRREGVE